jgi:hypothetical protein
MAASASAIPPVPPDVQQQQTGQNPLAQYADNQQQSPQQVQQSTAMDLVEQLLNEISKRLQKIAEIAAMEDPAKISFVKKMSQVGAAFLQDVQKSKQSQSQGPGPKAGLEPAADNQQPQEGPPQSVAA